MDEGRKGLCVLCRAEATQKCSGCRNVFYCGREHQKRHWKQHSKSCKSFKLAKDPKVGRHYVATRTISAGEIVLRDEVPLVSGPQLNAVPLCLGCYAVLSKDTAVPCVNCGWPLCKSCTNHGPECNFTQKYKDTKVAITDFGYPHPTYNCISIVRALSLRTSDPDRYRKLLDLEDHCDLIEEETNSPFGLKNNPLELARFIKRFFNALDDEVTEREIARIAGILQVNGHEVPITDPFHAAVYHQASFLEHNCRANCSKSFTDKGGLVIRAILPISKGEHISICYTDALWGVTNRRHHLKKTKFFDCTCERCTDPTEFGTMFNAVTCLKKNCNGHMLPESFLRETDYICASCGHTASCEEVDNLLESIGLELAEIKKNDIDACKNFLAQHARSLHENHFYNIDVNLALAQIIGQQNGGLLVVDDELLCEKILISRKINDLLEILAPAETRIRGLILFEMHAALAEFGRRHGKDQLPEILLESKQFLMKALELLRYEPESLPEGKIAIHARRNLENLGTIFDTLQ